MLDSTVRSVQAKSGCDVHRPRARHPPDSCSAPFPADVPITMSDHTVSQPTEQPVMTGAMIRTPLILDSTLIEWQPTDRIGVLAKDLRADPGSGTHTWLLRIEPGADLSWESTSVSREGYLVAGQYQHSECVNGEPYTDIYLPGGYFYRPADAVNGGPEASAITESVWLLREPSQSTTNTDRSCGIQ